MKVKLVSVTLTRVADTNLSVILHHTLQHAIDFRGMKCQSHVHRSQGPKVPLQL